MRDLINLLKNTKDVQSAVELLEAISKNDSEWKKLCKDEWFVDKEQHDKNPRADTLLVLLKLKDTFGQDFIKKIDVGYYTELVGDMNYIEADNANRFLLLPLSITELAGALDIKKLGTTEFQEKLYDLHNNLSRKAMNDYNDNLEASGQKSTPETHKKFMDEIYKHMEDVYKREANAQKKEVSAHEQKADVPVHNASSKNKL